MRTETFDFFALNVRNAGSVDGTFNNNHIGDLLYGIDRNPWGLLKREYMHRNIQNVLQW